MQHLDTNAHVVQEIWKSKMILSKTGRLQAVVNYGHMMKYDTSEVYFFDDGVIVDFFNKGGEHSSHLTSSKGEYNGKTEDVIGKGNVYVESDIGEKLRTYRLKWDSRREKILSDTLVQIITLEQDTLYGVGFESNADLSRRVIHKLSAVSDRHIDFDKFEESLSRPPVPTDTTLNQDTTILQ
jgi:LPS export ABC transporter protein LptC